MQAVSSAQITWEHALNISGWIIGFIGLVLSIYYGQKSARLERERITFDWDDIQIAADDLIKRVKNSGFMPTVVFTLGSRSGFIAHLMAKGLEPKPPILVGMTLPKSALVEAPLDTMFKFIETNRWKVGVPYAMLLSAQHRVLVVDDWALSGDALEKIKTLLTDSGFDIEDIRTATLVATEVAIQNNKAPDFYWKVTDSINFFFPWGRAQ